MSSDDWEAFFDAGICNIDVEDEITKFNKEWEDYVNDPLINENMDELSQAYAEAALEDEPEWDFEEERATKNDDGLVQFGAIPPLALFELGKAFTVGAKKYDNHNYRKGFAFLRLFSGMMRHAFKWLSGEARDPKDGQHHLSSVAWYALVLMEQEVTHPGLDDRHPMGEDYYKRLNEFRS